MNKIFRKQKTVVLEKILEAETTKVSAAFKELPWFQKSAYANWLAQTYFYVCHSTRLLAASASRFSLDQNSLHLRFISHMREEKSHEVLAERDLKAMGYSMSEFEELPATSALYQTQYFLIEHKNPIALFGYILFLENLSLVEGRPFYAQAAKSFGPEASSFLKVHAEEDDDHVEKAFEHLKGLTDDQRLAVMESMKITSFLYLKLMESLKELQLIKTF